MVWCKASNFFEGRAKHAQVTHYTPFLLMIAESVKRDKFYNAEIIQILAENSNAL